MASPPCISKLALRVAASSITNPGITIATCDVDEVAEAHAGMQLLLITMRIAPKWR